MRIGAIQRTQTNTYAASKKENTWQSTIPTTISFEGKNKGLRGLWDVVKNADADNDGELGRNVRAYLNIEPKKEKKHHRDIKEDDSGMFDDDVPTSDQSNGT